MAGLDKSFLYRIMRRVGEIEHNVPNLAQSGDLIDLIKKHQDDAELDDLFYVDKHLVFLEECGFLSLGALTPDARREIRLTSLGNMFLQPELSEFVNKSLLADIIKAIEESIQTLTYPEKEKEGLLYRMREAIAKQRGDLIVRIIMEIASRYAQAHGS